MKVVHLSLYDRYGGACIAGYRQHEALRRHGVDSKMWVRFKITDDPDVLAYKTPKTPFQRLARVARRGWLTSMQKRARVMGEMFSTESEYGADMLQGMPQADVVNIQFGWGFVDYGAFLRRLPMQVPVVVTMHEMANFTGGCAYTGGCSRFAKSCGNCPLLGKRGSGDWSHAQWQKRRAAFGSRAKGKLHFVADSLWIAEQARQSGLLKDFPVSVIYYGLDTNVFRPQSRSEARSSLGIPVSAKVVAFASASWSTERKGMKHLMEALGGMKDKPFLLTWGQPFKPNVPGIHHRHLGSLGSEYFAALAYNAADVFVMPSLEEAFGQTALESIACGVPVAAFAAGGIPETVRHEETGLLAKTGDTAELRHIILRLLDDEALRRDCAARARSVAVNEFGYNINARRYSDLYGAILRSR